MPRRAPPSQGSNALEPSAPGAVTALIELARAGDPDAEASLVRLLYDDLRRMAANLLARERPGHTLQTTDLVHDAYLRFVGAAPRAANRAHFIALAGRAMRQVLVDHARRRGAVKRDAGERVRITNVDAVMSVDLAEMVALDDALERLGRRNPRLPRVVELRFFVGLGETEIANVLGVTERTVQRDWSIARAWLHKELGAGSTLTP